MKDESDSLRGMSKTFRPWDVEQRWLLPPSVHELVPPGHVAHFVRDTVREELDLGPILSGYEEERGYPPYHPVMMVALLLYAYSRGVYSSRKIAQACEERVDFMAVTAMKKPDIFNTDQGSQFTGSAFTAVLANNGIAISMDGKGAWRDNVFVERLWRSVKYEEVYLRAYDSVSDARASIGRYLDFYNSRRPHSSLDGITPDQVYFTPLPLGLAA